MKQVPIRQFQQQASKFLDDLPIALTRYGRVVCYVSKEAKNYFDYPAKEKMKIIKKAVEGSNKKQEEIFKTCEHGAKIGLCKHGCTK